MKSAGFYFGTIGVILCLISATSWAAHGNPQPISTGETQPMLCYGLSDASAVVLLDETHFAVADDEVNVISVYRYHTNGQPLYSLNLSPFLALPSQRLDLTSARISRRKAPNKSVSRRKAPEADLEGAARLGERIYWITSHGRTAQGKYAPGRQCFFATTGSISNGIVDLHPIGQPYRHLLSDLIADARLAPLNLRQAATLPPKASGALNIEGLTETPEGYLLIGFRNPIPQGKALIVPLLNPADVIQGQRAQFGDPILLNLGGLGIRSMTLWRGQYYIVAGSYQDGGNYRLYTWKGGTNLPVPWAENDHLNQINPEAIAFTTDPRGDHLYLVSDDGTRMIGDVQNKKLKDPLRKQFRVMLIPL